MISFWDGIDIVDIAGLDDGGLAHIAEQRSFRRSLLGDRPVGAAQQDVGLDADRAQLLDGMLGRLGLDFAGRRYVRQQGQVDEDHALPRQLVAELAVLGGERVALNFLQHLSGIATYARRLKEELAGTPAEFLDTRKTIPGLRSLEKYAVRMGGGQNHRLRLDDGILIKNNHLRLAGGIRPAVENAKRNRPQGYHIEVEVTSLAQMEEAIACGADGVLLDNMSPAEVRQCVESAAGRMRLEVSGGIDALNIRAYAETGVDYISVGAVTHSAPAVDINFRIEPE